MLIRQLEKTKDDIFAPKETADDKALANTELQGVEGYW